MADLTGVAAWLALLMGGIHPQGHNIAGQETGVPVHVDYKNFIENWKEPEDWRKSSQLHAGGFENQNRVQNLIDDPNLRLANALYKLLYPIATPMLTGSKDVGDIRGIEKASGNKHIDKMLAVDALSDVLFDNSRRNISFETRQGTPVLLFNYRW